MTTTTPTAPATVPVTIVDPPRDTFYPESWGAAGDGSTNDTAALQACLDAAGVGNGTCLLSANSYAFTNLQVPTYSSLRGQGMAQTHLVREPGSTGAAVQEKGAYGAAFVNLRDFTVDGNGTSGDGVSLGNATGQPITSLGGIMNVAVHGFPAGAGFNIESNAESFYYLWSFGNRVGFYIHGGGASQWYSLYAESNSLYQIQVADQWNLFTGIQIESDAGSGGNPLLYNTASQNTFDGVYVNQTGSSKACVIQTTAAQVTFRDVVGTGGGTFTNNVCGPAGGSGGGRYVREFDA